MLRSFWNQTVRRLSIGRRSAGKPVWHGRFSPSLERLADRIVPAVTASFSGSTGTLSVFGDAANNTIVVSRNAAGQILVNGGAVSVVGGTPTVANTALVQVFG